MHRGRERQEKKYCSTFVSPQYVFNICSGSMGPYDCACNIRRTHAISIAMSNFPPQKTLNMQFGKRLPWKKPENPTCMERFFAPSRHLDLKGTCGTFCSSHTFKVCYIKFTVHPTIGHTFWVAFKKKHENEENVWSHRLGGQPLLLDGADKESCTLSSRAIQAMAVAAQAKWFEAILAAKRHCFTK